MVVIVIIGLAASVVVLAMPEAGGSLASEAETLRGAGQGGARRRDPRRAAGGGPDRAGRLCGVAADRRRSGSRRGVTNGRRGRRRR